MPCNSWHLEKPAEATDERNPGGLNLYNVPLYRELGCGLITGLIRPWTLARDI